MGRSALDPQVRLREREMLGGQIQSQDKRFRKEFSQPSSSLLRLIQAKSSQELRENRLWLECVGVEHKMSTILWKPFPENLKGAARIY